LVRNEREIELEYDIAIVGAGVAGLVAGRILATAGQRVALIEARNRVGGRIYTTRVGDPASIPIELGAEFIHGLPQETWGLLREAQLEVYEIDGGRVCASDGVIQIHDDQREGAITVLEDMTKWLAAQPPGRDMSFAEYLRHANVDPASGARATEYVEGFNAADSAVIGIVALVRQQQAEDAIDSDRLFRVKLGYDALPKFLAQQMMDAGGTLLLGATARQIAWRRGAVTIDGTGDGDHAFRLTARKALISVPLGVLQAGALDFAPSPESVLTQARRLSMGAVMRMTLLFRKRFWTRLYVPEAPAEVQSGLERLSFLFTHGASPSTWWTPMPDTAATLTAWVGGPNVAALYGAIKARGGPDALLQLCLSTLANALDLPIERLQKQLLTWHTHDWQADPYSLGAYSYAPAGAADTSALMTDPVQDTLYFAGEHTDTSGHWGTVHGALRSGIRAATQLQNGLC
jgi:monoamine oxidase